MFLLLLIEGTGAAIMGFLSLAVNSLSWSTRIFSIQKLIAGKCGTKASQDTRATRLG